MAKETRSLQTVRDLFSDPQKLEMAVKLMRESTAWGGMLARRGGQLAHCGEKERSSVLTSLDRHLRFLDTPAVAASTISSSFAPSEILDGKTTAYCVLPLERAKSLSGLLRVWVGSALRAIVKGGLQETCKVHFVLDEMSAVGHHEAIDDLIDKLRAFGARGQFYFQHPAQAKVCFPNGQDETFLGNTTHVHFGVNSYQEAEAISLRGGEKTIIVESGGTSSGRSTSWSMGAQAQDGGGTSNNMSENWAPQARKLIKAEEVLTESPRTAFTFVPGLPPIRTMLLRYYEEDWLRHPPGPIKQFLTASLVLAASAMMCALSLGGAVWISPPMVREWLGSFISW